MRDLIDEFGKKESAVDPFIAAVWQDFLLQFYRVYQFILQGAILIVGAIYTSTIAFVETPTFLLLFFAGFVVLASSAQFLLLKMSAVITARAAQVHHWQTEILLAELDQGSSAAFEKFKAWQVQVGDGPADSGAYVAKLVQRSGPTREVLDRLVPLLFRLFGLIFTLIAIAIAAVRFASR